MSQMDNENEVYKGYLLIPSSGKLLIKKTWQQKYCYLYKLSKFGIERLEIMDNNECKTKSVPHRIITLENCIKITSNADTHFTITTKTNPNPYEFNALNMEEKAKWLSAFQSVAFPDDLSQITSIEEDNDLYCSSGEGIFNVRIHPSAASQRCGLDSTTLYTLVLTSTAIQLKKNSYEGAVLYTWPYHFIRRYGYKNGKFTFEAGRKCDSGEGTFFLEHSNQQEIFRCVASKMKSMKKFLKDDSILYCGDNQFHAALSMEARSRSPLPPSPTASTSLHDIEVSHGDESIKVKRKPMKPPRKTLPMKQTSIYEPIDKYDKIVYRNDAWKTLGVDEVKHTENIEEEDEEYISWGGDSQRGLPINHLPKQNKAPKIITTSSSSSSTTMNTIDDDYDKLNFFGSSNKLNLNSGYKQIALSSTSTSSSIGLFTTNQSSAFNDYDEVQPALEEIRLADDSHLGYALIRKSSNNNNNNNNNDNSNIDHHFHNNEPYAVISKPKRV